MSNFFYEYKDGKVFRVDLEEGEKIPLKGKKINSFLDSDKEFSKKEVFIITKQLLDILGEMRSVFPPVIHKNITPSCIVIKKGWEIALIGFNKKNSNKDYMAPEALTYPTPKSDLYSVGNILIILSNNNVGDNFKKFTDIMTQANPDNRFRDIKIAKLIFEKIENNTISDNDWYAFRNKVPDDISNFSSQEKDLHNEFEASLNNLDEVEYRRGRYNRQGRGKHDMIGWFFAIPLMMIMTYVGNNYMDDDECDIAPRGYYNDEDCNLHKKSASEIKREIMDENKRAEDRRKRFKSLGVTGKR